MITKVHWIRYFFSLQKYADAEYPCLFTLVDIKFDYNNFATDTIGKDNIFT